MESTERLIGSTAPVEEAGDRPEASPSFSVDVLIAPPPIVPAPATQPATFVPPAPAETVTGPQDSPAHVSEEPQFVEAFAEPGAEEGAGASVHVREPWEGYGRMTADAMIARMADAGPEELAAVELYERAHRGRHTVLAAAERQLRRETAAAADQAAITQNG